MCLGLGLGVGVRARARARVRVRAGVRVARLLGHGEVAQEERAVGIGLSSK